MTKAEKAAHEATVNAQFEESIKELPEDQKALMRTVKAQISDALAKQTEENRIETAKALQTALDQLEKQETIKAMANILEQQGLAIRRIETGKNETAVSEPRTFAESFKAGIEAQADKVKEIIANQGMAKGDELNVEFKSAVNITEATTILAGSTYNSLTQDTGIISPIRSRLDKYLPYVTTGTIGTRYAMWMEETDEQGAPIFIAEANGKTKISVLYVEKTQPVQKIAVHSKVSTEMLADLPQLTSRIQNSGMRRVGVKIETDLFTADGVAPNIKGAESWATAWSGGTLAGTIAKANEFDVIHSVANQVELAFGTPNVLWVHPDTVNKLFAIKSDTGEPLYKQYESWTVNGVGRVLNVGGMTIVATPAITSGEFLGGDASVLNVLFRENMNVRMVPSGDDPINNLMTIIIEARLVQFVSANDAPCLVYGNFETAIGVLNSLT